MGHVVLLVDSIFDNAAYVGGGPDVGHQVRERLWPGWQATVLAVDASVAADVKDQLARLPRDATHLEEHARSIGEAVDRLASIREAFDAAYGRMLESVLGPGRQTVLCTVYDLVLP